MTGIEDAIQNTNEDGRPVDVVFDGHDVRLQRHHSIRVRLLWPSFPYCGGVLPYAEGTCGRVKTLEDNLKEDGSPFRRPTGDVAFDTQFISHGTVGGDVRSILLNHQELQPQILSYDVHVGQKSAVEALEFGPFLRVRREDAPLSVDEVDRAVRLAKLLENATDGGPNCRCSTCQDMEAVRLQQENRDA